MQIFEVATAHQKKIQPNSSNRGQGCKQGKRETIIKKDMQTNTCKLFFTYLRNAWQCAEQSLNENGAFIAPRTCTTR